MEAIEKLYQIFKKYKSDECIEACPHCELDENIKKLYSKPLKSLDWDDFEKYPFKAVTTFGSVDDFKHFLPRLLELYFTDFQNAHYHFGIILAKLKYAEWEKWDIQEIDTIILFFQTWLSTLDPHDKESEYDDSIYDEFAKDFNEYKIMIFV